MNTEERMPRFAACFDFIFRKKTRPVSINQINVLRDKLFSRAVQLQSLVIKRERRQGGMKPWTNHDSTGGRDALDL